MDRVKWVGVGSMTLCFALLCFYWIMNARFPEVDRQIARLQKGDVGTRIDAVRSLSELRDVRAVVALIAALHDEDHGVRQFAAVGLGDMGDPRAIEPLIAALEDEHPVVQRTAAWALGKTKDIGVIEPLVAALKHETDYYVRYLPTEIRGTGAAEVVGAALKDEFEDVVAQALSQIKDARTIKALTAALKDEVPRVQHVIAETLVKIGASADPGTFRQFCDEVSEMVSQNPAVAVRAHHVLARVYEYRGAKEKAQEHWAKTGFIREASWLVIGPFDGRRSGALAEVYPPEKEVDVHKTYQGVYGTTRWKPAYDDFADAYIDFKKILVTHWCSDVVEYALSYASSPTRREAQLRVGSTGPVKVWLNGKEVLSEICDRDLAVDQYTVPVSVEKGRNEILVKVCGYVADWGFYLRITDTEGKPFDDLEYLPAAEIQAKGR